MLQPLFACAPGKRFDATAEIPARAATPVND